MDPDSGALNFKEHVEVKISHDYGIESSHLEIDWIHENWLYSPASITVAWLFREPGDDGRVFANPR